MPFCGLMVLRAAECYHCDPSPASTLIRSHSILSEVPDVHLLGQIPQLGHFTCLLLVPKPSFAMAHPLSQTLGIKSHVFLPKF